MKSAKLFAALLFCCLFSPQAAYPQDFSSIDSDLQQLEDFIADTLRNTEEQQKLLEDLQKNLSESGNLIESYESIITRQEQSLANLQQQLNEMSETYRRQSALSGEIRAKLKVLADFYADSDTGNGAD